MEKPELSSQKSILYRGSSKASIIFQEKNLLLVFGDYMTRSLPLVH